MSRSISIPRKPRRRYLLSLLFLLGIGLVLAGVLFLNARAKQSTSRDSERQAELIQWQTSLLQEKQPAGVFPKPSGSIKGDGSVTGGLPSVTVASIPQPPRKGDMYYYSVTSGGNAFTLCAVLEKPHPREAFFANQDGTFVAPASACYGSTSPELAKFVTDTALTTKAIRLFYDAKPTILDKRQIQQTCEGSAHVDTQFAGCYDGKIYILHIDQSTIASEMGVTAAHEMLHAAYAKLSESQRSNLNRLLQASLESLKDEKLTQRLSNYETDVRLDEAHSILGTEYANLPDDLAAYYRQYFTNRAKVVAVNQRYERMIDGLEQEINRMEAELRRLDALAELYKASGNIVAYNGLVPGYNELVQSVNAKVDTYNALTAHTRPDRKPQPEVGSR